MAKRRFGAVGNYSAETGASAYGVFDVEPVPGAVNPNAIHTSSSCCTLPCGSLLKNVFARLTERGWGRSVGVSDCAFTSPPKDANRCGIDLCPSGGVQFSYCTWRC